MSDITEHRSMDEDIQDCRSEEGVTVGLLDALMAILRVLAPRDLSTTHAQEALADLTQDPDLRTVLAARQPPAGPGELTADEARALVDDLGFQLYQAQDALSFVEECCVIADREGGTFTTADVRKWLKGAQCGRQLLQATSDTQRVTRAAALYERWLKDGPPPLGVSLSRWWDKRLIEFYEAVLSPDRTHEETSP